MNVVASALLSGSGAAALGVLAALAAPRAWRSAATGLCTAAVGAAGLVAGVAALRGGAGFAAHLPWLLPLSGVRLELDALGGLFVAVVGGVVAAAALYGIGYAGRGRGRARGHARGHGHGRGHGPDERATHAALPVFAWAMLLVPCAASVPTLLVAWELMAGASLVLVAAEHRHAARVRGAALWYAAMTQLGFVAILLALVVLAAAGGTVDFAGLRDAVAGGDVGPAVRGLVFVLALAGFGSKAGLVPLHVWLPRAHPEAPAPVSAMLSAGMVNLGAYGVARFGLDLLHGGSRWWWLLTMAVGAGTALYGILQAAVTSDLKRLLAYSTVENMGLIFLGLGAAGLLRSVGAPALAGVALAAALLHVVNHAAFKALLFGAAGSVLRAAGTRDLDALGGLRRRMPVTTAVFAVGALGASALPLGNGFVSEWLLLQSLVHAVPAAGVVTAIAMPLAVAAVALTAGLAVATMVKALGVGFFARARSAGAAAATESPATMLLPLAALAAACVGLAAAPAALGPALEQATAAAGLTESGLAGPGLAGGAATLRLAGVASTMSPLWVAVAVLAATAAAAVLLRLAAVRARRRRRAPLWDCGAGQPTPRMQYTATSFAQPLLRVFDDVLAPDSDVDISSHAESRHLVARVAYRLRVPDRVEHRLYRPVIAAARRAGRAATVLANGSVHRYLAYGFVGVTALLTVLAVTS